MFHANDVCGTYVSHATCARRRHNKLVANKFIMAYVSARASVLLVRAWGSCACPASCMRASRAPSVSNVSRGVSSPANCIGPKKTLHKSPAVPYHNFLGMDGQRACMSLILCCKAMCRATQVLSLLTLLRGFMNLCIYAPLRPVQDRPCL